MTERKIEKRACERFVIPGATMHYKKKTFFFRRDYDENSYPLFDISRGGLRFLTQERLAVGTEIYMEVLAPGEEGPLVVTGRVTWNSQNPEKSYKYQIGIQFAPYGEQRHYNPPEALKKIIAWEERFRNLTD
jgi:Tfp pilus assembly protein PilZ